MITVAVSSRPRLLQLFFRVYLLSWRNVLYVNNHHGITYKATLLPPQEEACPGLENEFLSVTFLGRTQ